MKIKTYDILTIDNNKYLVTSEINYSNKVYYYLANIDIEHDLKFIYIEENEFYEVQDSNLILELFAELAKLNIK